MMTLLLATMLVANPAVGTPLDVSLVPPNMDMEKYLAPPSPPVKCSDDMTRYEQIPVSVKDAVELKLTNENDEEYMLLLRSGMLMSDCGFVRVINTAVEHKRFKLELGTIKDLRLKERDLWTQGEYKYQLRIMELEEQLKNARMPSFWDEWKAPIMYGLGIATAIGVTVGTAYMVNSLGGGT